MIKSSRGVVGSILRSASTTSPSYAEMVTNRDKNRTRNAQRRDGKVLASRNVVQPRITAVCRKGQHHFCTSLVCTCPCGHPC
jgi:hypothetical protein